VSILVGLGLLIIPLTGCSGDSSSSPQSSPSSHATADSTSTSSSEGSFTQKSKVTLESAAIHVAEAAGTATLEVTLTSPKKDRALIGASSGAYALSEVGVLKKGKVVPSPSGIALPADKTTVIDGSTGIVRLSHPLRSFKRGDKVSIRLLFADGTVLTGEARIDGAITAE